MSDLITPPAPELDESASSPDSVSPRPSLRDWPRGWAPDIFFFLTAIVVSALAYVRVSERIATGPSWDTYAFLDNAADMAGRTVGYVEPHRPPMMSFLTSLLLRFGWWDVSTIQIVDSLLTVVGILAFYLLLRRRFERPLAMVASVLLMLVPPLWTWLGSGYTDFPSVALSIVALFLLVKATEDDPRWYWIALPMVLCAILTRFGAFLMIFPTVLWMALRARPFRHAGHIAGGLLVTGLAYVPAGAYYFKYFSDPFFPFSFAGNVAGAGLGGAAAKGGALAVGLSRIPGWYFLKNAVQLLFQGPADGLRTIFLSLAGLGLLAASAIVLARQRSQWRMFAPLGAVALVLLAEWRGSTLVRVGALMVLAFVMASVLVPAEEKARLLPAPELGWRSFRRFGSRGALALDATILLWGLLFFDAHGHMQPQIDRYFITMAPAAIYFIALGWRTLGIPLTALAGLTKGLTWRPDGWFAQMDPSLRLASVVAILALGTAAAAGATGFLGHYSPNSPPAKDAIVLGAQKSAQWLLANDPQIRDKTIYSDVWPLTSWYLGSQAYPMPTFESAKAFPHELAKNRVDYFVTIRSRRYPGYSSVYGAASTTVLKYQSTFPRALPAIAYLGDGWDAYVEQLANFDCDLFFSNRRQVGTGTYMLDAMSADELAKYDAVAVFGAHWRNKGVAEKTLRTYVENGGVVIMDASHNMDGFTYPLVDTVFLDVLVRRAAVSPSATMYVDPQLAAESRVATAFAPASFADENGGPWYGANYEPANWARAKGQAPERFEVLASVGDKPAILLEQMGKGRIYWVSNNLFWHAYLEGNADEVRLVRGLIRDAVGLPPIPQNEVATDAKPWFISRKLRKTQLAARSKPSASTDATSTRVSSAVGGGGLRTR